MAGQIVNRQTLDEALSQMAFTLRELARRSEDVCGWIDRVSQEALQADPFNYTEDEAFAIKVAAQKVDGLRSTYAAPDTTQTPTGASIKELLANFTGIS
jgi:hypothetical protein